ncbi:MAG: bifunctional phosphopantothenoylcysteine decarboxylase/phosphopantothenate--cysteine ligase CoaBC [Spirulina sp. SIO3F2]|nr:bifunctional phosphopantothenoylcysteine decarboxylase/phosphopantothenate--cysteine ligase CoaBC [Spirulina sp. SIO3F2]
MFDQRRVLIGIGGGIAAYKVCAAISALAKAGAEVRVVLTEAAQQFITPLTVATLSRHSAYTDADFWAAQNPRPLHIELGEWADCLVLAPATANTLAKLAHGLADNLLTNIVLASRCPILLAPAMNTEMWQQATVQQNWQQLCQDSRYHCLTPGTGILACDRVGAGRLVEPDLLLTALQAVLHTQGQPDLTGKHLLVSAGGTREHLDPVRFIGNPSTGRMGVAIAQAAFFRGATVTLVHGPLGFESVWPESPQFRRIEVTTAAQMQRSLTSSLSAADWLWMVAAVADVRPAEQFDRKLPKAELPTALALEPVPDLVAELGQHKLAHQKFIGFAAQTGEVVAPAIAKLQRKGLDAIVANAIDQADRGFGSLTNSGVWITASGQQRDLPLMPKSELAHRLLDYAPAL